MKGRHFPLLALAPWVLGALACFERPLVEAVDLCFEPDGSVTVVTTVRIAAPEVFEKNDAVLRRLEESRRDLLEGRHPWSRRIDALNPSTERVVWEKADGRLERLTSTAAVADPSVLARFFEDTDVRTLYGSGAAWAEFTLLAGESRRATSQQRRVLAEKFEEWTAEGAIYLQKATSLWRHLEERPERARACLGALFESIVDEAQAEALPPLTDDEVGLVRDTREAMVSVASVHQVSMDDSHSLEEISQLVHDPFPAFVRVGVPGRILEVEGFEPSGEAWLAVRPSTLWTAFKSLEGRWIDPDPAVAFVRYVAETERSRRPFDLDGFIGLPRRAGYPPAAAELRSALASSMEHPSVYRVRFALPETREPERP